MVIIELIEDKKIWEDFLSTCKQKTFLQSWNWGQFQKSLGNPIWRLGIFDSEKLVAVSLVIEHRAQRGSFLLIPHGPVTSAEITKEMLASILEYLKVLAKKQGVDFIRISPIERRTQQAEVMFKKMGFRLRPLHTHPESSWKLSLASNQEQLFDGMRKTTRYSLRQAEKNTDLKVYQSTSLADIELFNTMHREVSKIQKFVPFSLEYFKKEFSAFLPDNEISIFFATYKGKVIAASFEIFWSGGAFYHHAALLPEYKKLPASYLLQWEAIKEAKKRGCTMYDFWGYADPVKEPNHPYSGPTLFKMGFGGYMEEYVKTQDYVITPKYWLNYVIETARRIRRGL